ncbi:actin-histidine N-methyltransferase-like [Babylonia areolata]|uniref:actin-histidine N-methyltransferase-like n=1 Tax=Babylonia areolata TaxID=304850 RepID=UPI003FD469F5
MGRKNKKGGGGGAKAVPPSANGNKESAEPVQQTLSKSAKREITELVTQLLEICSKPPSSGAKELEDYPEIHGLVEKIRKIQSGLRPATVNREQAVPAFMEWLHKNGVDSSAVEIQSFPGYGLGLKANKDIKESDLLLKIPRALMMTVDSALKTPLGELIREDKILQVMPNVTLAMHLLVESKSPKSFWKPYLDILPDSYTTPLYFSPDELQHLKGSPTLGNSITQYRSVARQYAYFYRLLQKHAAASKLGINENFTFDDYRWAVSTVMTRQNLIPREDSSEKKTYGLIPLWDMCNHTNGIYSTDFDTESNCSLCYSQQDVAAGDQVFMFYGPRSNGEFLVHNGFVFPDNEHDRLCLKLGISKGDPLCDAKSEVLGKISLQTSRSFFLHCGECPVDGEMLAFLRIFTMDEETLMKKYTGDVSEETLNNLMELESPVSADNEEKVWGFLETRAALLLKAYPTSVKDDEDQLKQTDLPHPLVMALQLRLGEKKILQQTVSFASRRKLMAKEETVPGSET